MTITTYKNTTKEILVRHIKLIYKRFGLDNIPEDRYLKRMCKDKLILFILELETGITEINILKDFLGYKNIYETICKCLHCGKESLIFTSSKVIDSWICRHCKVETNVKHTRGK